MRTQEEINKIEQDIENYIYLNNSKRVDDELINSLNELEIFKDVIDYNDNVTQAYFEYLKSLSAIPKDTSHAYLEFLKDADIIDNQRIEKEDSFLIAIYSKLQDKHAIDILLENTNISKETLVKVHDLLIKNTTSAHKKANGFRTANTNVVGEIINGKRHIHYFPLDHKKINLIADKIVYYINDEAKESYYRIFIKPIIIHGLIAAYQLFEDGNTRLARTVQNCQIYNMTNKYTNFEISLPAIYMSRQYYPFRQNYRDLITDLVLKCDNEAWNNLIMFNLKRIEEAILINIDRVEEMYEYQMVKYKTLMKDIMNIKKD